MRNIEKFHEELTAERLAVLSDFRLGHFHGAAEVTGEVTDDAGMKAAAEKIAAAIAAEAKRRGVT